MKDNASDHTDEQVILRVSDARPDTSSKHDHNRDSDVKNARRKNLSHEGKARGRVNAVLARKARVKAGLPAYRSPTELAREKPNSRRLAIYAMCYECQGGGADPGWRWAIGNCGIKDCPLHPHRSHRHKQGESPEGVYR